MLDIAEHQADVPVALRSVAERQAISESYLEQLFLSLKKAGLITGVRGARGGYALAREPGKITIIEVLRALEGPIAPVECVNEESREEKCSNSSNCAAQILWRRLRDSMVAVLETTTLGDLLNESKRIKEKDLIFKL